MSMQGKSVLLSDILKADDVNTLFNEIREGYVVKATTLVRAVKLGAQDIVNMLTTEFTADYGEQLIALMDLTVGANENLPEGTLVNQLLDFAKKAYLGEGYSGRFIFQKAGTMGLHYIIQLSNTEKDSVKSQINATLCMIAIKTIRDYERSGEALSSFLREFDFKLTRKEIAVEQPRSLSQVLGDVQVEQKQEEVIDGNSILEQLCNLSEESFAKDVEVPCSEESQYLEEAAMKFLKRSESFYGEKRNRSQQYGASSAMSSNKKDFVDQGPEERKRTAGIPGIGTLFS